MAHAEKINRWTTRFVSDKTETAFQRFIFAGNLKTNTVAVGIPIVLNALYIFVDPYILEYPGDAVKIRLSAIVICLGIFACFRVKSLARHHETLSSIIVLITGVSIGMIIWREPTLENNYYAGLIQGGVFISFLLRISFIKSSTVLLVGLVLFAVAMQGKTETEEAAVQIFTIAANFAMCAFGIYFLQRFRRNDFLKTQVIENQNVQLSAMLADSRRDNERKLAAMNMLVHLVKTPVHQISGFTDIVLNALTNQDKESPTEDCIESAVYIKNASDDLSANVSKLLTYHRLDDLERSNEKIPTHLTSMLQDARDEIDPEIFSALKAGPCEITNYVEPIQTALNCLVANYNQHAGDITQVEIVLEDHGAYVVVKFIDNGPGIEAKTFKEATTPLTQLDNYLTYDSSNMPMGLRTVARAAELCGGALTCEKIDGRNVLALSLRNFERQEDNSDAPNHLRLVS